MFSNVSRKVNVLCLYDERLINWLYTLLDTLLFHAVVLAISVIDIGMITRYDCNTRRPLTRTSLQGQYNLRAVYRERD